jgi:diguanylate cyclase (GGDEF)-like protein
MLLPVVAVAGAGVLTFRSSAGALEAFRDETIDEFKPVETLGVLLEQADDVGESYVEKRAPGTAGHFEVLSGEIEREFVTLTSNLDMQLEQRAAERAFARWELAADALSRAASLPPGRYGKPLDDFHDLIDEAGSLVSEVYSEGVKEITAEISGLQLRERDRLLTALAILVVSSLAAGLVGRKLHRSIAGPLRSLEKGASCFGSDDLSHRIHVAGDDELARVSHAFNDMAGKLQKSRDELHEQALHDPLTGLPNRTLFIERVEHALLRSNRRGTPLSVLYLDLDEFKAVNDTRGHEAGDSLLIEVSDRLKGALRAEDTAARLGGDEFAVLLEEADQTAAKVIVERLSRTFRGTRTAEEVPIAFSIGVATREHGEELDLLLRQADAAMYAAKAAGKGGYRIFGPDLSSDAIATRVLRTELQLAIDRDEFVVHYQPIVSLTTGAIEAVESLVRWDHPERGVLPPSEFLQEAEDSGHILYIDRWVLGEACRQIHAWQEAIPAAADLCASVNLSAKQLEHSGLAEEVADVLRSTGLAPESLILEITETALVHDIETAAAELGRLKHLGVKLALDDFGTGFSSLTHLMNLPIDIIKIDRSFVSRISEDEGHSEMALAIVKLAKRLGLKTVAEGIECKDQFDYLRSLDCELGQGYYFAKPVDSLQLEWELLNGPETISHPGYVALGSAAAPL